ncbi:MAG: sulfotransferase [Porticoccaceae bacterium]|nr:sulfotransferase [Pseudomonadales bacterium]MCP5171110.1 sulfotransferase [Pseudomonadales bacterium]MCP5301653.1 sulfotransferase [Pseudomonadales bacterium]
MSGTIIASSGRCGSTMMSSLLNQHTDILSVSEFLIDVCNLQSNLDWAFTEEKIDGEDFWRRINLKPDLMNHMLRLGCPYQEMLYPYKKNGAKFNAQTYVPALCMTFLPHISDYPDQLYDELEPVVRAQPLQGIRQHYEDLWAWLMLRLDKKVWVERSGTSIVYVEEMLKMWPESRYIHMFRDGRDTCYSMRNHVGFKFVIMGQKLEEYMGVNPFLSDDRTHVDKVPEEFQFLLPENLTKEAMDNWSIPIEILGHAWSADIKKGFDIFSNMPDEQVLHVDYDRFCANPEKQLRTIAEFCGVDSTDQWIKEVTAGVSLSKGNWQQLPADKKASLDQSCQPGNDLIDQKIKSGIVL